MDTLYQFQQRAANDLRRWLEELDGGSPRATLSVGILKQAFSYAEELLRRAAGCYLADTADGGAAAIGAVGSGKKKDVARLTFGECVQLVINLDSDGRLGARRVISKADRALLEGLSLSRNRFTHGSPSATFDAAEIKPFIADVLRLSQANVIQLAALREAR